MKVLGRTFILLGVIDGLVWLAAAIVALLTGSGEETMPVGWVVVLFACPLLLGIGSLIIHAPHIYDWVKNG